MANEDPTKPNTAQPQGDGWKSRKALITAVSMGVAWATATAGWMWLGKMSSAEWVSFNQWVLPSMAAIYASANVMEKRKK